MCLITVFLPLINTRSLHIRSLLHIASPSPIHQLFHPHLPSLTTIGWSINQLITLYDYIVQSIDNIHSSITALLYAQHCFIHTWFAKFPEGTYVIKIRIWNRIYGIKTPWSDLKALVIVIIDIFKIDAPARIKLPFTNFQAHFHFILRWIMPVGCIHPYTWYMRPLY